MKIIKRLQPQKEKITVFAFGEGKTEKEFLKHIKTVYQNETIAIKLRCGKGKSPEVVVEEAIKQSHVGAYDLKFVLLDIDKPWKQEMKDQAGKMGIELIGSEPCCIEGFFLSLIKQPTTLRSGF